MQNNKTAIVWFTNNLRVIDNESLHLATHNYERVIAVYCCNPLHFTTTKFGFQKTGKFRAKFLLETINNLYKILTELKIPLLVNQAYPHQIMSDICTTYKADALFYQKEFTKEETDEIELVKQSLPKSVQVFEQYEQFLFHPEDIPFTVDEIPRVFTAFRKKVEKYAKIRPEYHPKKKDETNLVDISTEIPTLSKLGFKNFEPHYKTAFPFLGGETEALKRIEDYFFTSKKLAFYKQTRNGLIGTDYSSKLSSWLANGSISAKTIYYKVKAFEQEFGSNRSTYWLVFELIWRDFFKYIALKHQNKLFTINGILEKEYEWKSNEVAIQKWINGETHEPFVNANMIELKETGWMSNRGRQNVASYFVKELQLDWRIGAEYFESMLIDYDVHSNYGNWQYVAGVGNDPRDRKFNVQLQAQRYDTNHKFRDLWLQKTLF